jgi:hypothetical protein
MEKYGYDPLFENKTKSVFHHAVSYVSGLITLPRRSNMSRIAENVPDCGNCHDISHFISSSPWSAEEIMKLNRFNAVHLLGPGVAVIFDKQVNLNMG